MIIAICPGKDGDVEELIIQRQGKAGYFFGFEPEVAAAPEPELTTDPADGSTVDFGLTRVGETTTLSLTATNTGGGDLSGVFGAAAQCHYRL